MFYGKSCTNDTITDSVVANFIFIQFFSDKKLDTTCTVTFLQKMHKDDNDLWFMQKTIVYERKQANWSEDSPAMDTRIINEFLAQNPNCKITTVFHSGVKHLVIVYETS